MPPDPPRSSRLRRSTDTRHQPPPLQKSWIAPDYASFPIFPAFFNMATNAGAQMWPAYHTWCLCDTHSLFCIFSNYCKRIEACEMRTKNCYYYYYYYYYYYRKCMRITERFKISRKNHERNVNLPYLVYFFFCVPRNGKSERFGEFCVCRLL